MNKKEEPKKRKNILRSDEEMGFLDHLEELRFTILRCVGAFAFGVILLAFFLPTLTDFLRMPYDWARGGEQEMLQGLLSLRPLGVFTVMLQVLFLGGLAFSLPFMLYAIADFIAPALTPKEKKVLIPGLIGGFILFIFGVTFSFFVILPAALRVSIVFNDMLGLEILWGAAEYYSMVVWVSVFMGLLFEFPMILVLLVYLDIITTASLRKQRKVVFILLLVLSASITPPDPVTLFILVAPLYGLYELAILIGTQLERKRMIAEDEDEDEYEDEDGYEDEDEDEDTST